MRLASLGRSGLRVSDVALGTLTWGRDTDEHEAVEQLELYLAAGGNVLDTSDAYGSGAAHEIVGHLLHSLAADDVIVVSRSGGSTSPGRPFDHSLRHLRASLEATLTRLGRDSVDVWLVHGRDPHTPLEEVCAAMAEAVRTGKAAYVGLAEWPPAWTAAAHRLLHDALGTSLTAVQVEYSLVQRGAEHDLLDYTSHNGLGVLGWGALGRGVLTGKYRRGTPADSRGASTHLRGFVETYLDLRSRQVVDAVCAAADGLGVAPLDVALAWARQQPAVSTSVVGARTAAQLRGILAGLDTVLPPEIAAALAEVSAVRPVYPQAGAAL